ncbi:MAG: hypothetical protein PF518_14975 [Spirochaetaceae bacterium]|nr:hypothetical protein [Spirochaetaceae bacterium]
MAGEVEGGSRNVGSSSGAVNEREKGFQQQIETDGNWGFSGKDLFLIFFNSSINNGRTSRAFFSLPDTLQYL